MRVRMIRPAYWTRPDEPSACALYRLFDAAGSLLYVGIGFQPRWRLMAHRRTAWGRRVDAITVCWFPSEAAARQAEKDTIRLECPAFNRLRYRSAA